MQNLSFLQVARPQAPVQIQTVNPPSKKLRVVTLNYLPSAYKFVTDWIHENGHQHVLAVTSPGIKTRATPSYKDVLEMIPSHVNTVVTSKMKSVLTPILPQFEPDLILCFTFAHRLDADICKIPTYGAINIHPSVLPLYRGPNPLRQFYEGAAQFGATAHRIEDDYDTGEILCQASEELPEFVTHKTSVQWGKLIKKCIAQGVERAVSGQSGFAQNHHQATYGGPYRDEEKWVDLKESSKVILRKTLGLNLAGGLAKAEIDGKVYKIHSAMPVHGPEQRPGTVIRRDQYGHKVATADGVVRLVTELFDPNKKYANVLPSSAFFS